MRKNDGVSYDAVMSMAVHVKDVETLAERVPFDRESSLDPRWHGARSRRFLDAARKFVADTKFLEFISARKPLYDFTNARLRAFVAENADLAWFDRFFGARTHAPFIVIPGLVNGGPSYAAHVKVDGVEEIYAIPGVWKTDKQGQPDFDASWTSILVHELTHSYVGPLLEPFRSQLESSGDKLYQATQAEMQRQAYASAGTVLNESLTRAATAQYILEHQGAEALADDVDDEENRSFVWTGALVETLGKYAADRARYPTLDSFMPQVVACFKAAAGHVDKMLADYDATRPKIVSMTIAGGARDVDPALKEIVITFDRPMRRTSYSVAGTGSAPVPKLGAVSFDATGRIFTIPVTLEPNAGYAFSLNWLGGGSFRSAAGVLLKPVEVKFHTR